MITCKEDLMNTYIENDFGELRDLYLAKCEDFGLKTGSDRILQDGIFDHYDSECFEVLYDGVYFPNFNNLSQSSRKLTMSDLKDLKPRIKTVYEKVDLHINEIAKRMIEGQTFCNHDGSDWFDWKLSGFRKNGLALTRLNGFDFYRRVEKEIDWREEVHNKLQSDYHWSTPIGEVINDESDCFLELCRVALRATGELE